MSQPLPSKGVAANVRLDTLDIDAWQQLLQAGSNDLHDPTLHDYLPQRIALRSEQLQWQGRQLHHVVAGLTQHNGIWQASLDARELSGHLAYHLPTTQEPGGSLRTRLARLALPPSARTQVNRLLWTHSPATCLRWILTYKRWNLAGCSWATCNCRPTTGVGKAA